ncbi:MAG: MSCRAMM family protein, partial [Culicoidibacterales bacterium]
IANTKTPVNPKIGQIKIIKQDKITLDRLKGAEFDIKDASGKVVMHVVTGTDGAIQTDALPFGKYTIVETKAPKGYQIDPEIMSVVIDINHLLVVRVSVGLKESQPVGIIGITKKDKKNGLNLAGAEFDIKDADGKIVDHVITDVQGYGVTKSLPLGLYTIIEVKAPAGYKLDKTVNSVVINDADEHVKITINNEKLSGPITPEKPKPVTDVKVPKMEEKLPDTGNGENCDNGICILSFMFVILLSISARFYSNNKSI